MDGGVLLVADSESDRTQPMIYYDSLAFLQFPSSNGIISPHSCQSHFILKSPGVYLRVINLGKLKSMADRVKTEAIGVRRWRPFRRSCPGTIPYLTMIIAGNANAVQSLKFSYMAAISQIISAKVKLGNNVLRATLS